MSKSSAIEHNIQMILERGRSSLTHYRFHHVLGVTHTIVTLAHIHGLDPLEAAQAGLLHDISKEIEPGQICRDLALLGEPMEEEDQPFPKTWHGIHAAAVARHEMGIDNPRIHEAIRYHTTAEEGIGPLAMALIVADLTEPSRKPSKVRQILKVAKEDLLAGFRLTLQAKVDHIRQKKGALHPRGLRAVRNYLPESLEIAAYTAGTH